MLYWSRVTLLLVYFHTRHFMHFAVIQPGVNTLLYMFLWPRAPIEQVQQDQSKGNTIWVWRPRREAAGVHSDDTSLYRVSWTFPWRSTCFEALSSPMIPWKFHLHLFLWSCKVCVNFSFNINTETKTVTMKD